LGVTEGYLYNVNPQYHFVYKVAWFCGSYLKAEDEEPVSNSFQNYIIHSCAFVESMVDFILPWFGEECSARNLNLHRPCLR
jgi:hypothetical protein